MGWAALERIADLGVSIGSHTRTHPRLNRVDASQLQDEIAGSAQIITDRLGKTPRAFAFPYGDYDVTALEAARRTYATAVTTELRAVEPTDDALRLPRLDAISSAARNAFSLYPAVGKASIQLSTRPAAADRSMSFFRVVA